MHTQPAASYEVGTASAASRPRPAATSVFTHLLPLGGLLLCTTSQAAHADLTPTAVLSKMKAVYASAKSFQGVVTIRQQGKTQKGEPFSVTATQQIKYQVPNLASMRISQVGTGKAVGAGAQGSQIMVSDGKTQTIYLTAKKQYIRRPAQPNLPILMMFQPNLDVKTAKMLPGSTVAGRAAYVLTAVPILPPNAQTQQALPPVTLSVDKQNFHLLRIVQTTPNGTQTVECGPQTLNGAIAASTFKFSPPAGASEFKMPTMPPGGMGGRPGMPPPGVPHR